MCGSPLAKDKTPPTTGFYWNVAMLFGLLIVCGCFYATMAELSICNRPYDAQSLNYSLILYRKHLLTPTYLHRASFNCMEAVLFSCKFSFYLVKKLKYAHFIWAYHH